MSLFTSSPFLMEDVKEGDLKMFLLPSLPSEDVKEKMSYHPSFFYLLMESVKEREEFSQSHIDLHTYLHMTHRLTPCHKEIGAAAFECSPSLSKKKITELCNQENLQGGVRSLAMHEYWDLKAFLCWERE